MEQKKEILIEKLKEQGMRITKQRLMLLDIILEEDCSSCKEIYYRATKLDPNIGTATVYRMINTLEEIGAINRKNMYRVTYTIGDVEKEEDYRIELEDDTVIQLSASKWKQILQSGLEACGYTTTESVRSVSAVPMAQ